jgi:hypothetical protein
MLKIPLPLFYVAATKDDELFVVDGLQRLSAIRSYVTKEDFTLKSLEFLRELEGEKFSELPERMRIRIEETELDFVVINPDSPQAVQRNIFKRLNTGGLPLTDQEIRHALYHGPVTELLKTLVNGREFQNAVDRSVNDSRMAAQELVLRFLAFSIMGVDEYRKDDEMDAFLSDAMQIVNASVAGRYDSDRTDASFNRKVSNVNTEEIQKKFTKAMIRAAELFDKHAFRKSTPRSKHLRPSSPRTPINKSLFEVWAVLLSDMDEETFERLKEEKEALYERLDNAFSDSKSLFGRYVGQDSTRATSVKERYKTINEMVHALTATEIKT